MRLAILGGLVALLLATPATAQIGTLVNGVPPVSPETATALAQMQAQIPSPADSVPSIEAPGGAPGATMTFRRGDAVAPRITRSGVFTVSGATGLIGGTWSTPLPAGASSYPMFFTGIGPAGSMAIDCIVISSTNTAFSAQCRQGVLTLSLLSAPISILAPTGTQVYALALPATQVSQ